MTMLTRRIMLTFLCCILLFSCIPERAQGKEFVGNMVIENGESNGITEPLIGPGRLTYTIYTKCYESIDVLVMDEENAKKYVLGEPCTIVSGASVVGTWNASVNGATLKTGGYVIIFDNTEAFAAKPSQNIGSKNVTIYYRIEYIGIRESSGFFKDINVWTTDNMQCIAIGVVILVILISLFAGKKRTGRRYHGPPQEHAQQPGKKVTVTRRYYKMPPEQGYPPQHGQPPQQGYPPNKRRPPNQPPY
jgi:hypothetical protein